MTTNTTPPPEAIVWRGIRFEHRQSDRLVSYWVADGFSVVQHSPERFQAHMGSLSRHGKTPAAALDACVEEVESIARAVGLIPSEEEERAAADIAYCPEHNFIHGAEAERLREELEKLIASHNDADVERALAALGQLATKLGKGER